MWRDGVNQKSLKMSNLKPLNVYCTFWNFYSQHMSQHVSGSLFLARGVVHSLNGASFSPPSWFLLPPQLGATCSLMGSIAVFTVKQTSDLTFCSLWAFAEKQIWQEKSGWFILGRLATIWTWASSRSGTRLRTQWNGVADGTDVNAVLDSLPLE